jgi:hypothetical protein
VLPVLKRAVECLPARLQLRSAQLLAAGRVEFLRSLIAAVEAEAGDWLF